MSSYINKDFNIGVFFTFLFIFGVVFTIVGFLILYFGLIRKRKNCTEVTKASIVRYVRYRRDHDSAYCYYPVFAYNANGVKTETMYNQGRTKESLPVGTEVDLFFNPNNISDILVPKMYIKILSYIFIGIGGFCCVLSVILSVFLENFL